MTVEPLVRQLKRTDLVRVVDEATQGLTASTRAKLLAVAESTDAVAVGWFFCGTVDCPARQARRRNQAFMTAFDKAMCERFGVAFDQDVRIDPFVVEVVE